MTLLADPPEAAPATAPVPPPSRSTTSTWRLAARLARRETRRRPGRSALVALLIAIPVLAMTLGSILVRTHAEGREWSNRFERRYGAADVAVDATVAMFTTGALPADPPVGTRSLDYLWVYTYLPPTDPDDTALSLVLTDAPLDDPMVSSAVEILDGRAPVAGEVLIGPDLAAARDLVPGDELTLDRPSGTWTISGVGRYRDDHWVDLLVIPGFDRERVAPDRRNLVAVYDLADDVEPAGAVAFAAAIGGVNRYEDPRAGDWTATPVLGWGWVAGVLALVAVGIVVAAAFATSARRQLVTIGQLAANGAPRTVIRRSLALQGTWTAAIGALVGTTLALVTTPFVRGFVARNVLNHDLPAAVVSVRDLVVIAVTAMVAGTVAAAVPASSAARVPVLSAMAGRTPHGSPPRWLVPTGIALVAGGLALLAAAGVGARVDGSGSFVWPLLVVVATVGVVFGMVCATPLVVALVGGLGRSAPLTWRFAVRSLGRSRTRSAAVVAAIAVTVGGAVAGAAVVEKVMWSDRDDQLPVVPGDAVVVLQYDDLACCEGVVDAGPLPDLDVPDDIVSRLEVLFPGATAQPLLMATYDPPAIDWATYGGPYPDRQGPVVATPAMLDLLGLADDDIDTLRSEGSLWPLDPQGTDTREVIVNDAGEPVAAGVVYPAEGGDIVLAPPLGAHVPRYSYSLYRPIVTPEFAERIGFELVERGATLRTDAPLTATQREALATALRTSDPWVNGTFIEPGDPPSSESEFGSAEPHWAFAYDEPSWRPGDRDLWRARAVVLAAALLLTGLVVAIALSLAAAEGRDERDLLAVVGARPASMRRQAAARAAVLAALGIALGVPTGYAPTWVLFRTTSIGSISDGFEQPLGFPWIVVGSIAVVIPVVVASVAWMGAGVAGRLRPPTPARRD